MKLRNRLILVTIGVIIFIILTPILILFTAGFKFDFGSKKIIKTGSLVVRTVPEGAVIFLDGKKNRNAPAVIRFLTPKDYTIMVAKGNFQSWTKRLTVRPQLVTWANSDRDFITLFSDNPKLLKTESGPLEFNPNEIGEYYLSARKVVRKNPSNGQELVVYENADDIAWDKSANRLLIWNNNEILIFDHGSPAPELILRSISPISHPKLNWYTGYVFFQNEGKIKAIELDGRDHRNIYTITDAMDDFILDEKGKILQVFGQKETKEYLIR